MSHDIMLNKRWSADMETMYERIRRLRKSIDMTQTELAVLMGYSDKSMIAKIEAGKVDLTQSKIVAAAKALRTTPSYLLDGDETTVPENYIGDLSPEEQRVIMAYRQASEERRQIADDILQPRR